MELRKIKSKDLFLMFNIINKLGIKEFKKVLDPEQLQKLVSSMQNDKDITEDITTAVGTSIVFDIVGIILEGLPRAKDDINSLLAGLAGVKVSEIEDLDIDVYMGLIVEVVQKPEFPAFFKAASKLFKTMN